MTDTTHPFDIEEIYQEIAAGDRLAEELCWDPKTKRVRPVDPFDDSSSVLSVTPQDLEMWQTEASRIVVDAETVDAVRRGDRPPQVDFACWDGGDTYTLCGGERRGAPVLGAVLVCNGTDEVSTLLNRRPRSEMACLLIPPIDVTEPVDMRGFVRIQDAWVEVAVEVVPLRKDLFSRLSGLFETDVLQDKRVFLVGLGSGGAPVAIELAKCGVCHVDLMDHDRLEVGNVVRHPAGLSDIGRYKTKFVAEAIHEKNPYADVRGWEIKASWNNAGLLRELVRHNDLVVVGTDNRESRIVLNRLCVEEGKPCLMAACFRRAYGGQVLFIRPNKTLCYQCFLQMLPEGPDDQEVSSTEQAESLAYTDRRVPIEPGLSNDIAPISQMVVKLALQYLLQGTQTTLRSLDDDLIASWYLWINRREAGTSYEQWGPLGYDCNGLHVMRWYGVNVQRDPHCPVCGDYVAGLTASVGVQVTPEDVAAFTATAESKEPSP